MENRGQRESGNGGRMWRVAGGVLVGAVMAAGCGTSRSSARSADRADYYAAGQAAEGRGDVSGAERLYERGAVRGPNAEAHERSLNRLGVLYAGQKKYRQAAGAWERYVALRPRSAEGWDNLGQAWEQAGDFGRAEAAYRRGIEADAEDHSCQVNLGMMLVRRGNGEEGMRLLEGVMRPAEAHYSLGVAYEQAGEGEKAREEFRKAAELDPAMGAAREKGKG